MVTIPAFEVILVVLTLALVAKKVMIGPRSIFSALSLITFVIACVNSDISANSVGTITVQFNEVAKYLFIASVIVVQSGLLKDFWTIKKNREQQA